MAHTLGTLLPGPCTGIALQHKLFTDVLGCGGEAPANSFGAICRWLCVGRRHFERSLQFNPSVDSSADVLLQVANSTSLSALQQHASDVGSHLDASSDAPLPVHRRQRTAIAATALDPDNASVLVAGGAGIALDVTRTLKDMGAWVWMLQRSDSRRCPVVHSCCSWDRKQHAAPCCMSFL